MLLFKINIHQRIIKNRASRKTVLNFDNNYKCFIWEWLLKDHVTLKSNGAENTALITEINDILQYIQMENSYLKL